MNRLQIEKNEDCDDGICLWGLFGKKNHPVRSMIYKRMMARRDEKESDTKRNPAYVESCQLRLSDLRRCGRDTPRQDGNGDGSSCA